MPEEFENLLPEAGEGARSEEPRPFSHDEMVTCQECLRSNPPTRSNCLYCGLKLPQTAAGARGRLALRRPENWEEGYNLILAERAQPSEQLLREVAALLRLEREEVTRILDAAAEPLPLARVDSQEEAGLLGERLRACGLSVLVISDRDLMIKDENRRRVRAFDFEDDYLVAYATGSGEVWRAPWTDLLLMITGRLVTRRVEMDERRKGGASEVIEAREMTGDLLLLDLYTAARDGGWRLASDSFDFSCLGERKALVASQNFASLIEVLRERAPRMMVDAAYNRLRQALAPVWPPEERRESGGLRRERPGRFNVEAVMTSDNETQFTLYSRLRHLLRLRQTGDGPTSL